MSIFDTFGSIGEFIGGDSTESAQPKHELAPEAAFAWYEERVKAHDSEADIFSAITRQGISFLPAVAEVAPVSVSTEPTLITPEITSETTPVAPVVEAIQAPVTGTVQALVPAEQSVEAIRSQISEAYSEAA